jgi:hypothetical protein
VEGEHVYWLPPLASPAPNSSMKAADVIEFPAVKLFMERAAASGAWLDPSDADAAVIAGICGRLDGIALAIARGGARGNARHPGDRRPARERPRAALARAPHRRGHSIGRPWRQTCRRWAVSLSQEGG